MIDRIKAASDAFSNVRPRHSYSVMLDCAASMLQYERSATLLQSGSFDVSCNRSNVGGLTPGPQLCPASNNQPKLATPSWGPWLGLK